MTRELLILLLGYVLVAGIAVTIVKVYLLRVALHSRAAAALTPASSPERMTSDDVILDTSGRIILALLIAGLGYVFLYLVLQAPEPPNADGTYAISQTGFALLILLVLLATIEVLQSVRGLVYLPRIAHALEELRMPPEACRLTTFADCPFITAERLQALRDTAHEFVVQVDEVLEDPHGSASSP